jgi:hypothetical protein
MNKEPEVGGLFRINYLRPQERLADSIRARRRLAAFFDADSGSKTAFVNMVARELGLEYPWIGSGYYHSDFWVKAELGDFLSAITIWRKLSPYPERWISAARRVFQEENLHYSIDDEGGVHFLVDVEFSATAQSAIEGLGQVKFTAARDALESGLKALGATSQSGKGLIRGVFEAVESAFLVVIGPENANRLNAQAIDRHLRPLLIKRYSGFPAADEKVARTLGTLSAWVNEAHPYRHGAPFDQIHEAPLEIAISSASIGMAFLRLLAGLDRELTA